VTVVYRLLGELKRRRVLNTASLFVIGAWVLLQVAEVLQDMLPPGFLRWLLIALVALYPLVIVAGWFFDVSADGIKRTAPLSPGEAVPRPRFIDHVVLAGHLLVIAGAGYLIFAPPPPSAPPIAQTPVQKRTIAVLDFEDLAPLSEDQLIGAALAEELRQGLTRTAGLRVMGPRTSEILLAAGDTRAEVADELEISSLLQGTVRNENGQVTIDAKVIAIPEGQAIWQASFAGPIGDAIRLQQDLMRSVIGAVAPTLDPDPVNGPRAEAGQCAEVYEMVLRGKQLWMTPYADPDKDAKRQRGRDLIEQATENDPDCGIAWEALATIQWSYSLGGYAKAGAAARRALELNDTLPEAWSILAEIAEQERRWSDAEEYLLKGLYADPTNLRVTTMYSDALIARGRVREALRHALDAYRREPAHHGTNWRVQLAAIYAGEWDLALKHIGIYEELRPSSDVTWWEKAYALMMKGERVEAMEIFSQFLTGDVPEFADWYLQCIRARDDEALRAGLPEAMAATLQARRDEELDAWESPIPWGWAVISCDAWIGSGDLAIDTLLSVDVTELQWFAFFMSEWTVLRQHPRFHALVLEQGLFDYWKQWGWSDYCEPVGEDDFRCD
jgi:TolB-like protein/tetratricopeptide (TPR) repeat protein